MSTDIEGKIAELKIIIRSLLMSAPNGRTVEELRTDFRDSEGYDIPFRKLGYQSISEFLRELTDVAQSTFQFGVHYLKVVADDSSAHIEKLVSRQKNTKKSNNRAVNQRFYNGNRVGYKPLKPINNNVRPLFIPATIRKRVVDLLQRYKNGIRIDNFCFAWIKKYGQALEFKQYGFDSLHSLLNHMSDDLTCENSSNGASACIVKLHQTKLVNDCAQNGKIPAKAPSLLHEFSPNSSFSSTSSAEFVNLEEKAGILSSQVRKNFIQLLNKNQEGIPASNFCWQYEKTFGSSLNLSEIGYTNIISMAAAHSDIFKFHRDRRGGDWLLFSKESRQSMPTKTGPRLSTDDLKSRIEKFVETRTNGISLEQFSEAYQKYSNEHLPDDLQNYKSLESYMIKLFHSQIHIDHLKGTVIVAPKTYKAPTASTFPLSSTAPTSPLPSTSSKRGGRPADIVTPGSKYRKAELSLDILSKCLSVRVLNVQSPGLFWFSLDTSCRQWLELCDQMDKFYNDLKDYFIKDSDLMIGQICAAEFPDDTGWYRCIITGIKADKNVEVSYVDFGTPRLMSSSCLRYLKKDFFEMPIQANCAALANIKPVATKWSKESGQFLLNMSRDKVVQANVKYRADDKLYMELIIPKKDDEFNINNELVYCGYAVPDDVLQNQQQMPASKQSLEACLTNMILTSSQQRRPLLHPNSTSKSLAGHKSNFSQSTPKSHPKKLTNGSAMSSNCQKKSSHKNKSRQYVKCIELSNNKTIHVINYNNSPYVSSGEISSLFGKKDNLHRMLRVLDFKCQSVILDKVKNPQIFESVESFKIPGLQDPESGTTKQMFFIYPLSSVPRMLVELKYQCQIFINEVKEQVGLFDPNSDYWMGVASEK